MFDQTPSNLPFEPDAKEGKAPPPTPPQSEKSNQAQEAPPSPSMQGSGGATNIRGGILVPPKKEPEDILSDVESAPESPQSVSSMSSLDSAPKHDRTRMIIIILAVLAGILIVVIAGIFLYQRFIAPPNEEVYTGIPTEDMGIPNELDSVIGSPSNEFPENQEEETESPPVVPPTPDTIPEPEPVRQNETMLDSDEDGLTDEDEMMYGTDPGSDDTDGDGLMDGEELSMGADPLIADTDGDGLNDGDEVRIWLSSPVRTDTDGDGFSDGTEVANGYNPNGDGRLPEM